MIETTTSDAVLARLEALTARLGRLEAENEALKARTTDLEAENARLTATLTTPTVVPSPLPTTTSRRRMLQRLVHASAAAALVLVAKEAATAEASANVSVIGPSTNQYGIAATVGVPPAGVTIPPLGGTTHSVIGSEVGEGTDPFYTPTLSSGVLGVRAIASAAGVQGINTVGPGVFGRSRGASGVHGVSISSAGVFAEGSLGLFATGTGVAGVFGGSNGNGFGFWGNSVANAGVYGTSTAGPGVRAESTNQWGLHAKAPVYAGVFEGSVFVTGRVTALGGFGASAAVTTRALAEDVGEATLTNGKATVVLAEDFAAAANGDYRVFLTELADLGGLFVARKGPKEFEVRSRGGAGQAAQVGRFDYRVVAKTAGANNPRQAPLAPPDLTTIKPAPPLPEPPKAPERGASEERRGR